MLGRYLGHLKWRFYVSFTLVVEVVLIRSCTTVVQKVPDNVIEDGTTDETRSTS